MTNDTMEAVAQTEGLKVAEAPEAEAKAPEAEKEMEAKKEDSEMNAILNEGYDAAMAGKPVYMVSGFRGENHISIGHYFFVKRKDLLKFVNQLAVKMPNSQIIVTKGKYIHIKSQVKYTI